MTREQVGRNTGRSGRVNLSGSELDTLDMEIGDAVDVNAKEIAHAFVDSKDSEAFLVVTPA